MKKIKLLGLLFLPFFAFTQQPGKSFTEKLEGISTSQKELTKNASTDNSSIGQGGLMTNSVPLVTVSSRTMSFPIQLQYASGIKVDQRSGPAGLGWVLPIGSITRDFGAYYPDYTSTYHESDMFNVVDFNNNTSPPENKGVFNTQYIHDGDTINGSRLDPFVQHKYLGFDAIRSLENTIPLSDMYHISVPGKLSNSFFNSGGINQAHAWRLTEIENWKIKHTVKNYKIPQEFSRINEINLTRDVYGDMHNNSSYATAIGVLPYVENGLARIALTNTNFVPTENDRYVRYDDFETFTVTDENGTKYVFGRALRGQRYVFSDDPYWSNRTGEEPSITSDKGSFWKIDYIAEWLLTEIQSPDYRDINGNKMADDGDAGDWIRFEYTEPTKVEPSYLGGSCHWYEQEVPKHREWTSYSQTDRPSSLMRELAYLQKIVTPTQEIDFTISERYDVEHDYYTKPANRVGNDYYYENRELCVVNGTINDFDINYPVETMKYDSIKIKSRLVDPKLYPNENLQAGLIKFNYAAKGSAQELAVSKYLIRNNNKQEKIVNGDVIGLSTHAFSMEEYNNNIDKRGKTTLLGLEFYGTTVSPSQKTEYKFEYGYNPSFDEFHKREIIRAFHFPSVRQGSSQGTPVIPFSKADGLIQTYKEYFIGASGGKDSIVRTGISPYDFLIDFPYKEVIYKFNASANEINSYTFYGGTTPDFPIYPDYILHGVKPIKDMYGYCYSDSYTKASEAWTLTKITYPTGGEVSFKYEPASFTESNEWSFKSSTLPLITQYNNTAKRRSYVQDAYNRRHDQEYDLTLSPKKLTATFELDLPLNYGIRLKEKTTNDKVNPEVKMTYDYENGTFTALPSEFLQNALSGFNQFISRENRRHSVELEKYYFSSGTNSEWDYDFSEKMSEMSHTNIALDDYSSTFFYKKIRIKGADSSFVEKEYGSALTENIEFPIYNLYCSRMKGGSFWQGSYVIGGNALLLSPISLKNESSFETNASLPYQKVSYIYERTPQTTYDISFDYNGGGAGLGTYTMWDVEFNYYRPKSSVGIPVIKKYNFVVTISEDTVVTSTLFTIGGNPNGSLGVLANTYPKWASSKTYLKKEITNYKGIVSEVSYRYVKNPSTGNRYVLRDTEKHTIGESIKYITRNKYAFEAYSASTSKFADSNLISLPYQTITYLNDTLDTNVLSSKVVTYDLSLLVPKALDTYQYETSVDPATGTFTLPAFSSSDPNWRVSESDVLEYNLAGMPVSTRSNRLYSKTVTGSGSSNVKASIIGTERPFDATYTGFEDFRFSHFPEDWDELSYLKEDWFTMESSNKEIVANVGLMDVTPPCSSNYSTPPVHYTITTDNITDLLPGKTVTFSYTTNGNTYNYPVTISNTYPTSNYPQIIIQNPNALDYFVCFQSAVSFGNLDPDNIVSKIVIKEPLYKVSSSYAHTGKYSYKLASIRTNGEATKKTPVRPVRIAPMTLATECNVPEEPGDGGAQSRNPNIPASCYWDYTASLWLKYDSDIPPLNPPSVPSTSFSDDPNADAIYRRGEVNTSTDPGVRIVCKIWNSDKTIVREEFTYFPQALNTAWKQYTIDFSVFKGPEQWVEVYVENTVNQVGAGIINYKAAFVDDIIVAPKESRYDYSVTNALGQQTFKTNNNDVFVQSTYDPKGRSSSTRNAYGKIMQELTYFDQPNWTTSENYVTEVKWVSNSLFNTTRYFMDGFGRTAQVQVSDHVRNLRMVSETNIYNNKGQVTRSYKPYYLDQYGLTTKHDATFASKTQTLYGSNYAYTDVTFEPKPESVVATVSVPRTNTESAIISSQTEYMNPTPKSHTSTSGTHTFPIGTLLVHEVVNPLGKITRTYLNRLGQVVMEEHQIGMNHTQNVDGSISFTSADLGFAQTWFYYDGAGRLVETYDPENKKTAYIYNSLGVLVKSISPDKGATELRYDKYGQVRFTRNQKDVDAATTNIYGTSQFKYVKYDVWGQSTESGVVTVAPNDLGVSTSNPPFPTGDFFNDYSKINNQNYPQSSDKFVQVYVKSNYTGTRKFYNSTSVTEQITYSQHLLDQTSYTYAAAKTDRVSMTYMADGQVAKTSYLYDGLPGTHQVKTVFNEMNTPIGKDYIHPTNSSANFKWLSTLDHFGRSITNSNVYNGNTTEVSRNFYDPMGNLLVTGLGATGVSGNPYIDYISIKKNIREQLISQMSKNFRIGLTYDAAGNITNQYWSNEYFEPANASSTRINQYAYTYDKMNRLIGADYKQSAMTSNPFAYYSTLNAAIPNDFACTLDGEVVALAFKPYLDEFESNIKMDIQVDRSRKSVDALKQLQSDYMRNNLQYSEMNTPQIDDFFTQYISNCNRNRLSPTEFEYYQATKANDNVHIEYLKNNPVQSKSFKYMKVILTGIPWTPPVNCMPNPGATAYGYLQNFPTPVASYNSKKYDAAYWYQKNGNFDTLYRNGADSVRTRQLYNYQLGTNKLTQASFKVGVGASTPYNYTYDPNGNILTDPKNQQMNFMYSLFEDLPVQMVNESGLRKYRYFNGTRSVKEISSTDREYYIDQVILDQNGTVKSYQTAAGYATPNGTIASYFYQVKDWLGSPHITMNAAGVVQNATDYYPYGKPMPGRSHYGTNYEGYRYQFTGHERDGETNYQYHGARYYDEDLARYMSVDPLAMKFHAWSTYNYVMGNPIRLVDPTGKGPTDWVKNAAGHIEYSSTATTNEQAVAEFGAGSSIVNPGYSYPTTKGRVVLGEGNNYTLNGTPHRAKDLSPSVTNTGVQSGLFVQEGYDSNPKPFLSQVNLGFFGEGFNSTDPDYGYFNPAWLTPEQIQAYHATDQIQQWTANALFMIGTGGIGLEMGILKAGLTSATINSGTNYLGQLVANDFDNSKVDRAGVGFAFASGLISKNPFTVAVGTAAVDASVDYTPKDGFRAVIGPNRKNFGVVANDFLWNSIGNSGSASFGKNPPLFETLGSSITGVPTNVINTVTNNEIEK